MQRERLINTRPKRDLCKQEQLEVGAAKWERAASKEGVGTVAFSVAFILTLRRKVISVIVTRFDNICNNFIRLTLLTRFGVRTCRNFLSLFFRNEPGTNL